MEHFQLQTLQPGLEELNDAAQLLTEITAEPLVEADDVAEDLNNELVQLGEQRDQIDLQGMNREAAEKVAVAVEGFLDRHMLRNFTTDRSPEGVRVALEEIDETRQSRIAKLWAWLVQRMSDMITWISNLFGPNGRATNAEKSAKDAAQAAASRKPQKVGEMLRDPAATAQEARIDPAGEKSGSFEDYVERHKQYSEPLMAEFNRINARIAENKIMANVCASPEKVSAFFAHLENINDKGAAVRNILDKAAQAVRSSRDAQSTAQEIGNLRKELYKLFGGESVDVLDTIGQSIITDQATDNYTSMDYDKLVPLMQKVTSNIPAANAQQRVSELTHLSKAVASFNEIAKGSHFKNLDPTHRNVLLAAMQGLANDVTKFVTAVQGDWTYAVALYGGVSSFWQSELAFYYKVIATIQKAATEIFDEADRKALYDNYKAMGFAMDLTAEEIQRRSPATESHVDTVALESIDKPAAPEAAQPFQSFSFADYLEGR